MRLWAVDLWIQSYGYLVWKWQEIDKSAFSVFFFFRFRIVVESGNGVERLKC